MDSSLKLGHVIGFHHTQSAKNRKEGNKLWAEKHLELVELIGEVGCNSYEQYQKLCVAENMNHVSREFFNKEGDDPFSPIKRADPQ